MPTFQDDPVISKDNGTAVAGESQSWMGVFGKSLSTTGGHGVLGEAVGTGVAGVSATWVGVYGESRAPAASGAAGVWGDGKDGADGVKGVANGPGKAAVCGFHVGTAGDGGPGVYGESARGRGVQGQGQVGVVGIGAAWIGVYGETHAPANAGSAGVWGDGKGGGDGVKGVANAAGKAAVCGFQLGNNGPGVFGQGAPAGHFQGDVVVTGDLVLQGADVAEQFDVADQVGALDDVAPGTVVVLDNRGALRPCNRTYDRRVAGVISGAGDRVAALVLDRQQPAGERPAARRAVAVVGKVWCRADASVAPIHVGDLLTTSSTPGHAMTAIDAYAAFGAVLGKALTPLAAGQGLVLMLVALG
jgi:hypothetical protein